MVIAVGPDLDFTLNSATKAATAMRAAGHSVAVVPLAASPGDQAQSAVEAMKDQPANAVLLLSAHRNGTGPDHLISVGPRGTTAFLTPTIRLLQRISEARAGRAYDCIISSCMPGMLHDRIAQAMPKRSLFVSMASSEQSADQYEFGKLMQSAATSPLTAKSLSADRMLLSYLTVAEKRWWMKEMPEPRITIVGSDFDANALKRARLGVPFADTARHQVQSMLGQAFDQSKPATFLPALLERMEAGGTDVLLEGEKARRHCGPQALAVALAAEYDSKPGMAKRRPAGPGRQEL